MEYSLRKLDLNLIKIFLVLMESRSVSSAADQLFITQSAVSHSLKKLREAFHDPLFVSTKNGMKPTPRAIVVNHHLSNSISEIMQGLKFKPEFDAANSRHKFIIVASEYAELVLLPKVFAILSAEAPNCSLEVQKIETKLPLDELGVGLVDIILGFKRYFRIEAPLTEKTMLDERLICVASNRNSLVGDAVNIRQYLKCKHIYPSPWGDSQNMVDNWLTLQKLERDIQLTVQNYLATPSIVENSDCLLTLPERIFQLVQPLAAIRKVEPPKDYPEFSVNMIWNKLYQDDPANSWLRSVLDRVCSQVKSQSKSTPSIETTADFA